MSKWQERFLALDQCKDRVPKLPKSPKWVVDGSFGTFGTFGTGCRNPDRPELEVEREVRRASFPSFPSIADVAGAASNDDKPAEADLVKRVAMAIVTGAVPETYARAFAAIQFLSTRERAAGEVAAVHQ